MYGLVTSRGKASKRTRSLTQVLMEADLQRQETHVVRRAVPQREANSGRNSNGAEEKETADKQRDHS